jgi:hypothetical protein
LLKMSFAKGPHQATNVAVMCATSLLWPCDTSVSLYNLEALCFKVVVLLLLSCNSPCIHRSPKKRCSVSSVAVELSEVFGAPVWTTCPCSTRLLTSISLQGLHSHTAPCPWHSAVRQSCTPRVVVLQQPLSRLIPA